MLPVPSGVFQNLWRSSMCPDSTSGNHQYFCRTWKARLKTFTNLTLSFLFLLLLSPHGNCQSEVEKVQASAGTFIRPNNNLFQTESGFMTIRRMVNHRNSDSFFGPLSSPLDDSFLSDDAGGGGDVSVNEIGPPIWTDSSNSCSCWNSSDGGKVREVECKCSGTMNGVIQTLPSDVHRIVIKDGLEFTTLKNEDLKSYSESLKELSLTDLPNFQGIQDGAFSGMLNLDTIYIMEMPSLTNLSAGVFNVYLPKLKTIRISHTALTVAPNLSRLNTSQHLDLVDLDNNGIRYLEPGWIKNIEINYLSLSYNRLEEIGSKAFSGSTISRLSLKGNRGLVHLDPEAFSGIQHLSELDLSETAITHLPIEGLQQIDKLRLQNLFSLRVIPSIYNFDNLKEAWLTFPYHCCAFQFPETHNPQEYAKHREFIKTLAERGCDESNPDVTKPSTSPARAQSKRRKRRQFAQNHNKTLPRGGVLKQFPTPAVDYDPFALEQDKSFGHLPPVNDGGSSQVQNHGESRPDDFGTFHSDVITGPPPTRIAHCGHVAQRKAPNVKCEPQPDAFSPCEDIMGNAWLRAGVWVVVTLALVGNTAVLVVLILAPGRMSVQRFLMANLSWADLCMGIYLLMVATEDLVSLGSYFNYAIDWQLGWGCQLAGFFTVFASELSVFTLAVITGERWYALTRALHLTKRLTITKATKLMSLGWACAIILAILPLIGVSSYSRTSICLPMEATTVEAQTYLAFLLIFNGVAFTLVAYAYWQMYRAVAGHGNMGSGAPAAHSGDAAIAKKMAILVFTDFACWAPVAFFGLTAVAGAPLIGVTDSKILLVFFYPLNACCNPYLYAIMTKQYRRDLLLLLSRHGICTRRAARYKTGQTGSTNNTMHTMQTILRLGSAAETKVTNGGRISVGSMGGISAGSSTLSGMSRIPSSPQVLAVEAACALAQNTKPQILSIAEKEAEMEDENDGRLLAETSFVAVPSGGPRSGGLGHHVSMKSIGKQKHVRISTGSSPEEDSVFPKLSKNGTNSHAPAHAHPDLELDVTESTPFCP